MKTKLLAVLGVFLLSVNICSAQEEASRPLILSLPELNWALEINAPGFLLNGFEIAPHGYAARFQAVNESTGIIMSGFLQKASHEGTAEECRAYYWKEAQGSPFEKTDIKMSQAGEMAIVEYFIKEYEGIEINQKNLNAYLAESDYWIDIHLSKINYTPADQQLFKAVLNEVKIQKEYKPDSFMLFYFGNLFFMQENYLQAIPYYQQALDLENSSKTLSRMFRLVLVDQLGMSYCISGNLEKAKEIYNKAIREEPEYPMFYYNLACVHAEGNDIDGAIRNLKLAYQYKENMLSGEEFPDPRTDSSFKRFLDNKTFVEELNKMK